MTVLRFLAIIACALTVWGAYHEALWRMRRAGIIVCRDAARFMLVADLALSVAYVAAIVVWVGWAPCVVVATFLEVRDFRVSTLPAWRLHRHHDEDCQFGPRRRPFKGRRPVLVAFAPARTLTAPA